MSNFTRLTPMLARAASLAASLLFTVVVARVTDLDSAGKFFTWFTVSTALGIIGRQGTDMHVLKHGRIVDTESAFGMNPLWRRSLQGSAYASAICACLGYAAHYFGGYSSADALGVLMMAAAIPLNSSAVVNSALLRANGRSSRGAFAEVGLTQLIAMPLLFSIAHLLELEGFLAAATAYTLASGLATAWSFTWVRDLTRPTKEINPLTLSEIKTMRYMSLSAIISYSLTWLPVLSLWLASTPKDVALFTSANRLVALLPIITTLQMTAILPQVATMVQTGLSHDASILLRRLSLYSIAVCAPAAVIFFATPGLFVEFLFGPEFGSAASTLQTIGPIQALVVALGPVSLVMGVTGAEREATRIGAGALVIGLPVSVLAAHQWGAVGAGLSGALAQLGFTAIGGLLLLRQGVSTSTLFPLALTKRDHKHLARRTIAATLTALALFTLIQLPAGLSLFMCFMAAIWPWWKLFDVWRVSICVSIAASVLRTGVLETSLPAGAWYLLQFGPLVLVILSLALGRKRHSNPPTSSVTITATLLALVCIISALFSPEPASAVADAALLAILLFVGILTRSRRWSKFEKLRTDIAFIYATIFIIQAVGLAGGALGQEWAFQWGARFRGIFSNPNYAAILAALSFMLGLFLARNAKRSTLILLVPAQLAVLGVMLWTGSRGALLSVAFGILHVCLSQESQRLRRWALSALIVPSIFVPILKPAFIDSLILMFDRTNDGPDVTSGRLEIWRLLFRVWLDHPVNGLGFHSVQQLPGLQGLAAHNLFLQFLVETGLTGFCVLCALFISIWLNRNRQGPERILTGGFVAVVANELTESSLTGAGNSIALTAWLLVFAASMRSADLKGSEQWSPNAALKQSPIASARGPRLVNDRRSPASTHR